MIKAKHNPIVHNFFKLYVPFIIRRNFHKVHLSGHYQEKNKPVLVIANHISWWDGFWTVYLILKVFHRKFHFMMLEDQLRKVSIFSLTGGFSIKKGSRSVIESLKYTVELLSDNRNLVLLFPQGKLTSLYDQSFHFEKGLEHIIKEVNGNVQIFFQANLIDYFSHKKPSLFIYLKEYDKLKPDIGFIQNLYNAFYAGCVAENIKKAEA
ncbi:MAG: lysophospholipid acyltransferase family protein [Bacteroidales bacterium]|nr:lysophospholipid acyltransferase family protein [Bacteroidales bacterium]